MLCSLHAYLILTTISEGKSLISCLKKKTEFGAEEMIQ